MVGRRSFPFGARLPGRCEVLVFEECKPLQTSKDLYVIQDQVASSTRNISRGSAALIIFLCGWGAGWARGFGFLICARVRGMVINPIVGVYIHVIRIPLGWPFSRPLIQRPLIQRPLMAWPVVWTEFFSEVILTSNLTYPNLLQSSRLYSPENQPPKLERNMWAKHSCLWVPCSSGQIIATSHDLGPQKVAFWKGNGTPAIWGKSRLMKYYSIWPEKWLEITISIHSVGFSGTPNNGTLPILFPYHSHKKPNIHDFHVHDFGCVDLLATPRIYISCRGPPLLGGSSHLVSS